MSCAGCGSGRGCDTTTSGLPKGCRNNGSCSSGGCNKLNIFDWLANMELPVGQKPFDVIEVRFKNSRKEFFRNVNGLPLTQGEVIAVEGTPGHDIGIISMTGELVKLQMKKKGINFDSQEIKKVYRKARQPDIEKWKEAQSLEVAAMYKARTIALSLKLQMKISDVEYQGDKTKATFYYTADDRVDFRELIKKLAEEFRVRIEMRQIGARQEASRLGGIGSCGRELCCATWLTDFRTVNTSAARYQQLSLNPLKLAGQCGKLKCCLNYELDSYLDAIKDFPENNQKLLSEKGIAFHQKTDIFKRIMYYTYEGELDNFIPLTVDRVKEVIAMNKEGKKPAELLLVDKSIIVEEKKPDYENVVGQDSLTRFDNQRKKKNKNRNKNRNKNKGGQQNNQQQNRGSQNRHNPNRNRNNPNNNRNNNNRNNDNPPPPKP
jgi:cell fate regulator YaaT (PSP1 superfamily)